MSISYINTVLTKVTAGIRKHIDTTIKANGDSFTFVVSAKKFD